MRGHRLADLRGEIQMLYTGLATSDQELQQRRDRAKRFLRATVKGREYYRAFKEETLKQTVRIDLGEVRKQLQELFQPGSNEAVDLAVGARGGVRSHAREKQRKHRQQDPTENDGRNDELDERDARAPRGTRPRAAPASMRNLHKQSCRETAVGRWPPSNGALHLHRTDHVAKNAS